MRHFQGSVTNLTRFFTEDCAKQSLFCGKLCLSLWCNLSYQNVSGTDFGTDTDDSALVKIL